MAISEDTAALVAAQLTVAMSARMGAQSAPGGKTHNDAVLANYQWFLARVQGR